MKLKTFLIAALTLISASAMAQQTTQLQGRVYLTGDVPAAYATLYLPQYEMVKNMLERFDKAITDRKDTRINLISPYNISYTNVVVK